MKHLGDITKLSGYDVPTVDVVIGGSPCQDLSVAGKQVGLKGERSGLFMEQIRLIKEMREADAARGKTNDAIRPRYMVWENVPGAFSSSQGRDFEAVLEETVRVAEPKAPPVPVPAKGWPTSGCLVGDGWTDIGGWVDSKGKIHSESSDAARYKALGNSIAIPPWKWVLKRLCAIYERDATMASLFDGIGGFPYIWEQLNGKGSCLWASEIEPFPIAVTKRHFGED